MLSNKEVFENLLIEDITVNCKLDNEAIAQYNILHDDDDDEGKNSKPTQVVKYGGNLVHDIEMFQTFSGEASDTLFNQINAHCYTGGSMAYIRRMLKRPLYKKDALRARQDMIRSVDDLAEAHGAIMARIGANESSFLWLFTEHDEAVQDIYQMVFYRSWLTSWLNGNERAVTGLNVYTILVSPTIGIMSPVMYFIVPYLILRFKMGYDVSFGTYANIAFKAMFASTTGVFGSKGAGVYDKVKFISYGFSMLFYFQSLFNSFELSTMAYKISSLLTSKVNKIVQFIRDCKLITDCYWKPMIPAKVFECDMLITHKQPPYFDDVSLDPFSVFSNFGSRLKVFKEIKPKDYVSLVQKMYMLDAIWAIKAKVSKDDYCYTQFDGGPPLLKMTGLWHPCIGKDKAVQNDVSLGGGGDHMNMMITGPNAGGKSTLIKAVLSNVVTSQTLTIAASKGVEMTPFQIIHSQINVPDCKGKESLFEAEMNRCRDSLEMLSSCEGPSITVMDEIFNSTNPVEGVSGAYAVAKRLGMCKSNISIISTHYMYLTKLCKEEPSFRNYKMGVRIKKNGDIAFPYKLSPGVSTQYIALELLRKNGFHKDLIDDALRIKSILLNKE